MTGTEMAGTNWFLRIGLVMSGASNQWVVEFLRVFLWLWWVGYVTLLKLDSTAVAAMLM